MLIGEVTNVNDNSNCGCWWMVIDHNKCRYIVIDIYSNWHQLIPMIVMTKNYNGW